MKKMARADSPDLLAHTSNDLFTYKLDPFAKSFRKKYQQIEPSTVSSSSNLIKTFSKTRTRPVQLLRDSPPKPSERRSHSKGQHSRQIEKISLASYAYQHAQALPSSVKLQRIGAIFAREAAGGAREVLQNLYAQNVEYMELLHEWQKLEIYDEVDRLIYKLTQSFTNMVETALELAYKDMHDKLGKYEGVVQRLQEENQMLKKEREAKMGDEWLLGELHRRVTEEYHKNQWGNAILQHIRKADVDLDSFIRKMPLYRHFAYGGHYIDTDSGEDGERGIQLGNISTGKSKEKMRLTKSQASSQSHPSKQVIVIKHQQNISQK